MKASDVFLQHSVTHPLTGDQDGLPVAILGAMALGMPVVSTGHAGIPEAVVEGETGLLIDEGDVQAMAQAIVRLGRDVDYRTRLGENGWKQVREHFSWERERNALLELLGLSNGHRGGLGGL